MLRNLLMRVEQICHSWNGSQVASNHLDFEIFVANALLQLQEFKITHLGGSNFPDILISGNDITIGIEVKSTKGGKGEAVLGGSIMEGTGRVPFDSVHVVYGDLDSFIYAFRKYRSVIKTIKITHSPRYFLDFSLGESEDFFSTNKIEYIDPKGMQPAKVFDHYRPYIGASHGAWWGANQKVEDLIIHWSDLPPADQDDMRAKIFSKFPELLLPKGSPDKYYDLARWLITNYAIFCHNLRDKISEKPKNEEELHAMIRKMVPEVTNTTHFSNSVYNLITVLPALRKPDPKTNLFLDSIEIQEWEEKVLLNQNNLTQKVLRKLFSLSPSELFSALRSVNPKSRYLA